MSKNQEIKNGYCIRFDTNTIKLPNLDCYGYIKTTDGQPKINEAEASMIRWIFERYLTGDNLEEIKECLSQKGISAPNSGKHWNKESLNKLLANERYTGRKLLNKFYPIRNHQIADDAHGGRYLVANNYPAIISEEIFNAVQMKRQHRSKSPQGRLSLY